LATPLGRGRSDLRMFSPLGALGALVIAKTMR
jgi:hypothetical protein